MLWVWHAWHERHKFVTAFMFKHVMGLMALMLIMHLMIAMTLL